jgi:O-antigen/teichoic acid export membrane protein
MQLATGISRLLKSGFVQQGSLLFAAAMLANASAFIFHAAVSRVLGINEYGALYALMAFLPLVAIPTTAFATVVTKFAAEFRVLHDDAHLRGLVRRLTSWVGLGALLTIVAGVLLQYPIAAFLHVDRNAVVATSVLVGVTLALPPLRAIFQGMEDFGRYTASAAIEGIMKNVFGILLAVIGWGVAGALAGYALGTGISLLYTFVILRVRYASDAPGEIRLDVRRIAQTMGAALLLIATITALSYADALIVKHYLSASDGGLYAAVSLGGKILLWVTSFIPLILVPKAANRAASGAPSFPILIASLGTWAALSACGLLMFYLAPTFVVRILVGSQFLAAAPLLFQYAVAMSLLGAMNVIANYKIALHHFDFVYPFGVLTIAELTTIAFYHPTLQAVIWVLVVGNTCGVIASLYRIGAEPGRNIASTLRKAPQLRS